jgi:uncharacterized membrane protein
MDRPHGGQSAVTVLMEALEENPVLGRISAAVGPAVDQVFGDGPVGSALRGRSIGHALHPLLVQLPIGALVSAIVLDATQGPRAARQSSLLTGLACLSVVPAVTSGLAEWAKADDRTQRVGIAHAACNVVGATAAVASWAARRGRWSVAGAVLSGIAGTAIGVGGLLGGHLSLVRKYASHDRPSNLDGTLRGQYVG